MNKLNKSLTPILLSVLFLMIIALGFAPDMGVSNMDSLHLSDFNTTATPNFLVNQRGAGVVAEFRDGGTPIATWSNGGDFTAGLGDFTITPGNLIVGDGTPTFTQDGEDAYIEGTLETASDVIMGVQSTISVVFGTPITPTGWYQSIQSANFGTGDGQVVTPIGAPSDDINGTRLLLYNINASQVITIDGTGTTVECKADIVLASTDTLELFWNGDDWKCIANYDNS